MTTFARVENGIVREIIRADALPEFHPDLAASFHPAPEDAAEGWIWDAVAAAVVPPPPDQAALLSLNAAWRLARETGGLTLPDGTEVATDRESQMLIAGAARLAEVDGAPVHVKARSGWAVLDAAGVHAVALAVARHVRAAFATEAAVAAAITRGEATTAEAVAALWST
jgi:hypothetical protein